MFYFNILYKPDKTKYLFQNNRKKLILKIKC